MRKVRLTFTTTIPDAETDDHAYLLADAEVAQLDPPGDWVFEGMEIERVVITRTSGQIQITDYDADGNLVSQRSVPPWVR